MSAKILVDIPIYMHWPCVHKLELSYGILLPWCCFNTDQSSVKMVSHFACVGGFNLNFGKRPFVASILMSMSDAEDPPMVCLVRDVEY